MNILFLSLSNFNTISCYGMYPEILARFIEHNHMIYAVSPLQKRERTETFLIEETNAKILKMKIGNITKNSSMVEKGISMLMIDKQIIHNIKKYFSNITFDFILYATPPITFCNTIDYFKKRDGAKTYLLLKDIFPQNAVDIGMLSKRGIKGLIYQYYRKKEKKLYRLSDHIGCMSQANVNYVLDHNPEVSSEKVEICPNAVPPIDKSVDENTKRKIRQKYGLPFDKIIFIYGGNLGKPQGIPFLIECLRSQRNNSKAFFLIVGDGTEYERIFKFVNAEKPENVKLMSRLPKEDYDNMVGACDVGMIFLYHRFTIPNFPSRLLSYMQAQIPILACTDPNTDIGEVIVNGEFGWWCESDDVRKFSKVINEILKSDIKKMHGNGLAYLRMAMSQVDSVMMKYM